MDEVCIVVNNGDHVFRKNGDSRTILVKIKPSEKDYLNNYQFWATKDKIKKDDLVIHPFNNEKEAEDFLLKCGYIKKDNGKWQYYHLNDLDVDFVPLNDILVEFAEEKLRG